MVLIYIDESGTIDYTDGTRIYLLNAILIKEEDFMNFYLNMITEKERIAYKYNLKNSNFELHASNLFSQEKGMNSIGKKLDFIAQELHRETNTINSKAQDIQIIKGCLALKNEVESIRQQVQNLE